MSGEEQLARIEKKLDKALSELATALERVANVKENAKEDISRHERRLNDHSGRIKALEETVNANMKTIGWGERFIWTLFSSALSLVVAIGAFKFKG